MSKEDIEQMVQEAEQFRTEDEAQKEKVQAKNSLESLAFNMKSTVEDEKLQDKISPEDKKSIIDMCNEVIAWLDRNQVKPLLTELFPFCLHCESRAYNPQSCEQCEANLRQVSSTSFPWNRQPQCKTTHPLSVTTKYLAFCYPGGREGWIWSPAEGTGEGVQPHHLQSVPGRYARRDARRDARGFPWWSWRLLLWPNYRGSRLKTMLTLSQIPTYNINIIIFT